MSSRLDKVNKHIQRLVGEIIQQHTDRPADVLITVSRVETKQNLHTATVWLYISPLERAQDTLQMLQGQMYDIQGEFNRAVRLKPLPRLYLKVDPTLDHEENPPPHPGSTHTTPQHGH